MRKPVYCILLLMVLNMLACSFGQPNKRPALHDLGPAVNSVGDNPANWSALQIDAPAWLWDEQIRYRLLYANPTQVRYYSRDRWVAPPPALLTQIMPKADAPQKYQLSIQLREFEQIFDQPGQARVILHFDALARHAGNGKIIAEQRFQLQQNSVQPDAQGAISGLVGLSHDLVKQVGQWLLELPEN